MLQSISEVSERTGWKKLHARIVAKPGETSRPFVRRRRACILLRGRSGEHPARHGSPLPGEGFWFSIQPSRGARITFQWIFRTCFSADAARRKNPRGDCGNVTLHSGFRLRRIRRCGSHRSRRGLVNSDAWRVTSRSHVHSALIGALRERSNWVPLTLSVRIETIVCHSPNAC
jgi:hypothetical protein